MPRDPVALKALVREQQAALEAIRWQALRHLTDAHGQLADAHGELVDAQGRLADTHGALASTQGQLTEAQARINYLLEQIVLARHRMFGASSEQSPDQVRLFDEAEVLAAAPQADEDDYNPSRGGDVPMELVSGFRGFQGFLMTDGYEAYNALAGTEGVEHQVCWAHCRRGFIDAQRVQPKGKTGRADEAVRLIRSLYKIERELKDADVTTRFLARRAQSVPILKGMRTWLDKALAYMHHYWPKLIRYVEWGDTPIDNNRAENAIRPFVVGRRAWLFSDTPAGAHASALIYSLVETAKANRLEPSAWLAKLLHTVPGAQSVEEIEALLPWNLHPATLPRIVSD